LNENKRSRDGRTDLVGTIIYAKRISKYLKGKCFEEFRERKSGI